MKITQGTVNSSSIPKDEKGQYYGMDLYSYDDQAGQVWGEVTGDGTNIPVVAFRSTHGSNAVILLDTLYISGSTQSSIRLTTGSVTGLSVDHTATSKNVNSDLNLSAIATYSGNVASIGTVKDFAHWYQDISSGLVVNPVTPWYLANGDVIMLSLQVTATDYMSVTLDFRVAYT